MSEALMRVARRVPRPRTAVRDWPLWSLPGWLIVFILAVIATDLVAIGVAAFVVTITAQAPGLCSVSCSAAPRSPSS